MRLNDAIGPAIVFGPVQIDDRSDDIRREVGCDLGFQSVDGRGAFIAVGHDLFRRQDTVLLHFRRDSQAGVRHGDQ